MTAPRQVLPGTSYLVGRRCSERRFFLRPCPVTNEIFLYVLAVAANRYAVDVHAFCVVSNHYHLIVSDPHARLPSFVQYLDSLVARATNASLGRWEGFWSSETSYSAVAHGDTGDLVRKAAYVLANPVSARLVRTGRWTAPEQLGTATLRARRPEVFFSATGGMPEHAELTLSVPEGFSSAEEFQRLVAAALGELEEAVRREAPTGGGFLGRARVLAQKPTSRPAPREPRRGLSPRVAARDTWKRIEVISRLVDFVRAYRAAWAARRSGTADVVFPVGTYLLRIQHGVRCAAGA
jgi:putative transposase